MKRLSLAVVISLIAATTLQAQVAERLLPMYTYAAKFVCGQVPSPPPPGFRFPPAGMYFSSVNVHNLWRWETVELRKKFAVALPGEEAGKISPYFKKALRADQAMQVECEDIYRHLGMPPGTYVEGYAVFESPRELDVVTVYAAGSGAGNQVTSIHTERVPVRTAARCLDLDLPLTTGTATWTLVTDPTGGSVPRAPNVINHPWTSGGVPFLSYNTGQSNKPGPWDFETTFCLCTGAAALNLTKLQADNSLDVYLNNVLLGTISNNATPAALTAINTAATPAFVTGPNVLKIRLRNDSSSWAGFALAGTVSGANIGCPR